MNSSSAVFSILTLTTVILSKKIDLDSLHDYSGFLNFGDKKLHNTNKENEVLKSKIDVLGEVFKKSIDAVKLSPKLDIVFLIDASSSVGESNFESELRFVKKLLSDITVDYDHTRVAVVTYSSRSKIIKNIDEIGQSSRENNKCLLLNKQLKGINYKGGETYTFGAFQTAKEIFDSTNRNDSKKVLFLITDGYSNGGDPIPLADELKDDSITIFTIGIQNGNYKELYEISSTPGQFYSYLLESFSEFESLARRALHVDLKSGEYIPLGFNKPCDILCDGGDCCDDIALCTCGSTTGHYSCVCQPGYYGSGLRNNCFPCTPGTYAEGPNLCLPCPDQFHITTPPAFGIDSCKCKEGYRATKNNGCKEVKCPKIITPENGYYVKKGECPNVINSACGIRCEVGYTLKGTSIRLCQKNGTWSGIEPDCEIRTCNRLELPKDGKMKCVHPDIGKEYDNETKKLPVDTVCSFKCPEGKMLIGSKRRTCLPIARWDGLRTLCKPIKCKRLPLVKFGKIEPNSCTFGKQEYKKKCRIICDDGFKLKGPADKQCIGARGAWDSKYEDTACIDITSPEIMCPDDLVALSLTGKNYAHVSWIEPNVTDNSGLNVTTWMKPVIENITDFKFEIGTTLVTYYAQDAFENKAKCSFHVTVKDEEPPTIENCIDPPPYLTGDQIGANVSWDEPNIFDNSQNVEVARSHEFGFFKVGTTTVTYTATDNSNNTNICRMNITVEVSLCESLPDPSNGHSECIDQNNGIQCLITCEEGYAIPISQVVEENGTNFVCDNADPIWYNSEGLVFPECTVTKVPQETVQTGEVTVPGIDNCTDTKNLQELENDIRGVINSEVCTGECKIETKSECETEQQEEESNKILKKRAVNYEELPHRNRTRKHRRKLNVKFQVRGKYVKPTLGGVKFLRLRKGYNASIRYDAVRFICPPGFVPRKNRCVQCPRGSFHNETRNRCQSCPFGFYNEKLGQSECISCPVHHSTSKLHSKKLEDCKEQCPPGTHARKKKLRYSKHQFNVTIERPTLRPHCRSCKIGYYQPDHGQLRCIPCPAGFTTTSTRSTSIHQCIPTSKDICESETFCQHGSCEVTNRYQYSCDCFDNYIGTKCEKQANNCDSQPCLNGGTCNSTEVGYSCLCQTGFTGIFCEETIDDCKLQCSNGGVCFQDDDKPTCLCPDGFGGDFCEAKIKSCSENLCENNGTCVDEHDSFRCECIGGFIGKRCNLLPCDYRPCGLNSICVNKNEGNVTKASYSCVCPEGFSGDTCAEQINHCAGSPCTNGGTCVSHTTNYSCSCTSLYHGTHCENKRNTKYLLKFDKYDTNNYIKLGGFRKNVTEISACLWMKTTDNFNYGSLISYATRATDNAFTITDYTGLVLYVNNNYVVTDVYLNDGHWHHVCANWRSMDGSYEVFVDGVLTKNGSGLSTGVHIQGYGNMIIGQEQDIFGGRFSQSESFVGKMAYIDVWSKALTYQEVLTHNSDCNESFFGDLYAWPEMQDYIQGGVEVTESSFCNSCSVPKTLYNGFIDVVENTAFYSCYTGYSLNDNKFIKGRKCSKASKWEGKYEPYCKKVYCGYPGSIRNGFPIGRNYYYNDTISFGCLEGYNLTGDSTILCKENGRWYPEKPRCIGIQCTAFKQPDNSDLIIMSEQSYETFSDQAKFEIGTQIEVVCDVEAELIGESVITCLENGTWDFEPPECNLKEPPKAPKLDCPIDQVPKAPINGYIDLDSLYAAGNVTTNFIEYKCKFGYKLKGENTTTCIIDGYWTEPNISCDPVKCGKLPTFKNMKPLQVAKDGSYHFGNVVSFECDDGYKMFGNKVIRCTPSGKWSKMQGKCLKKTCKKPLIKPKTTIKGKSYLFGDKVTITCPSGSTFELLCTKEGIWEGEKDESC
nr:sushi, von Willebrand factor type A, EGF and pentraxin domain-containing protein 1-like [Leptinotarsa decemlineata]